VLVYFARLGVSTFKEKEVAFIEELGNENARKTWLGLLADIKGRYPNPKALLELQEHFREKYIEKRFYKENYTFDNNSSVNSSNTSTPRGSLGNSSNNNSINEFKLESPQKKPSMFKKSQSSQVVHDPPVINITSTQNVRPNFVFEKNPPFTTRHSSDKVLITTPSLSRNNKEFDFSQCDGVKSSSTSSTNVVNKNDNVLPRKNTVNNADFTLTHDFTKSIKVMDSLNNLYQGYVEKKVDPLDKLFYQYNFSSGNNMRSVQPNNMPYQHNVYNNQLDCIYGINSQQLKF